MEGEVILVGNRFAGDGGPISGIINKIIQPHLRILAVTQIKEDAMGCDMKSGLDVAAAPTLAEIDGDSQMLFEDVILVHRKLKDRNLDFIKNFTTKRGDGFYRKTIYVAYNIIFNSLFPGLK